MLRSRWAAVHITSPMPKMVRCQSDGQAVSVGVGEGCYSGRAVPDDRQGRRRQDRGVRRRRRQDPCPYRSARPSRTWAPELGATTSIFPSDEETKKFLEAQGARRCMGRAGPPTRMRFTTRSIRSICPRLSRWRAMPHMPDNVKKVSEIGAIKVNQCCIGSCTNSSYYDMMKVAGHFEGQGRSSGRFADHQPGF